jgi:tetratricopeptide (TPR) repeat protein
MKTFVLILLGFSLISLHPSVSLADGADISVDSHLQRGNRYFLDNQRFSALDEYEQAAEKDPENPDILRKLSLIYYDLGFLDESVRRLEKAVSLAPHSELLRMDMGIAYLAEGRLEDAKKQFMAAIAKNPGLANAYYYLGEIFYRTKGYETAWLFAKRARCLGHKASGLFVKLRRASEEPDADPCIYDGDDIYIRQILVDTKSRAEEAFGRIAEGALFEDVAEEQDRNRNLNVGGYLGKFSPSEIDPRLAGALAGHKAFSTPVTVETELGFHIVQQIAPFHIDEWKRLLTDSARWKKNQKTAVEKSRPKPSMSVNSVENSGQNPTPLLTGKTGTGEANDKDSYLVYAGSNRYEQNAIEDVRKLIGLGYPAYRYAKTTESNGTLHIVVAGKYESFEKAREAADNIVRHGFSVFIRKAD